MIEKFEIIRYKCFNDFTLEGLSRINVISGKNNVGKTALLEAFFIIRDIVNSNNQIPLKIVASNRGVTQKTLKNYLYSFYYEVNVNNTLKVLSEHKLMNTLNTKEKELAQKFYQDYQDFLILSINDNLRLDAIDRIKFEHNKNTRNMYIHSSKPTNKKLVELYSQIQTRRLQQKFLKYLQILDKTIVWIEPQMIEEEMFLRINLKNPEHSLLSSELGEGTNRFIQILAVILTNPNDMVFIDEIENGLHYSRLYDIWKAIIEIVHKENVQLFVTTHDKESMEALDKASKDSNFDEVTSIELYKDENNKIVPIVMDYENFSLGLKMGEDARG